MMRAYEFMVILEGDLDETAAQAWVKTITDGITKAGGSIHGKADWWGYASSPTPSTRSSTATTPS